MTFTYTHAHAHAHTHTQPDEEDIIMRKERRGGLTIWQYLAQSADHTTQYTLGTLR